MLILSRKAGEQIKLLSGDNQITVQVLAVSGGRIRVGVTTPVGVPVHRPEAAPSKSHSKPRAAPLAAALIARQSAAEQAPQPSTSG